MTDRLIDRLGAPGDLDEGQLLDVFAEWAAASGRPLYSHQEVALLEIVAGSHVIAATPTGSGKSLIATAALFSAMATGKRAYYTAPIKALVSEKFFELVEIFGTDNVGMVTGDSSVNAQAPIICCTAEILAGVALRGGAEPGDQAEVGVAVLDEFHYYGDPQRGWAWQVPLLQLPRTQFVLMSATLGDVSFFAEDLLARSGREVAVLDGVERPVPLHFSYEIRALQETLEELLFTGRAPVYIVHFTQAAALERAQALSSINVASREDRDKIAELIGDFRFSSGFGKTLSRLIRHGIGVHHAGMLPKYRRLVEKLAQSGLLKVICGTDTLGVGINVPIRTVLLTSLSKYDGRRTRLLSAREFHQIAGRAGRAGFDTSGDVVVLAPEHEIENAKAVKKAGDDAAKRRKVVRRKAPEGFVNWSESTFDRLVAAEPEQLRSHLKISHSVMLALLSRPGDAVAATRALIEDSHEPRERQLRHLLRAIAIGKALLSAGVVVRLPEVDELGRRFALTVDLPPDFALDQPLSPLAMAAIDILDRENESYPLDVVSLFEATLEGPGTVLNAQRFHARGEAVASMKADGIEYEERMELLDQIDYPKPLEDLIEVAYGSYRAGHPWIAEFQPEPKSIVRDLYERAMTFNEYVSFYGLSRSEGVLLRYLADAYRTMRRTVPAAARTEEVDDLINWLGELVRGIDSSLLDEWEALAHPDDAVLVDGQLRPPTAARGITANERGFTILVRNAMFRRVELAARGAWDALGELDSAAGWTATRWAEAMDEYFDEYPDLGVGPDARSAGMITIAKQSGQWRVRQAFDDPEGDRDWGIVADIDLAASDEAGEAVVSLVAVGPMTG
ncbi:DEAD/DEAH box helicase [Nakamurella lactea]|uniref:DEAD/DEAH box helicase n=1 Tax=Nakamurella lactea TaxID=459515 RepID=UPI0004247B4B|nr:DEAD/DEAH box helicase [Nakamurella lactea]